VRAQRDRGTDPKGSGFKSCRKKHLSEHTKINYVFS